MADPSTDPPSAALVDAIRADASAANLEALATRLISTRSLAGVDHRFVIPVATQCFVNPPSPLIQVSAAGCLAGLLMADRRITAEFRGKGVIRVAAAGLESDSFDLGARCLRILAMIAEFDRALIPFETNLSCFLNALPGMPVAETRIALEALEAITAKFVPGSPALLAGIAELITHRDPTTRHHAIRVVGNIGTQAPLQAIPPPAVARLAIAVQCITDGQDVLTLLHILLRLVDHDPLAEAFIQADVDFPLILNQTLAKGKRPQLFVSLLILVLKVVIPPDGWRPPFQARPLSGGAAFLWKVAPFAERLVVSHDGNADLSLMLLAATVRLVMPTAIGEVLSALAVCALAPELRRNVVLVVNNLRDKTVLRGSVLLAVLKTVAPQSIEHLGELAGSVEAIAPITGIDSPEEFARVASLPPAVFGAANAREACGTYLTTGRPADIASLAKLVDSIREILSVAPNAAAEVPHNSINPAQFRRLMLNVQVSTNDTPQSQASIPLVLDFIAHEGFWNRLYHHLSVQALKEARLQSPAIMRVLPESECNTDYDGKLSPLYRACRTPGIIRYSYLMNKRPFSAPDSIFQAFGSIVADMSEIQSIVPIIEAVPHTGEERVHYFVLPHSDPYLAVLAAIYAREPTLDLTCNTLANRVVVGFEDTAAVIARRSPTLGLIAGYPYVFPLSLRLLFFRVTASRVDIALMALEDHFLDPDLGIHEDLSEINCVVARDNLWEDGLVVLERFALLRNTLSVRFAGENGMGAGPTREFFAQMSIQFRTRRDLWRRDPLLFPRPGANPHLLYLLGVFCAKAIALGYYVDLPIHPVFFEIVEGDVSDKTCAKIDRQWARSLEDPTAFFDLCFVFPDEDCEELVHGCVEMSVDEDNVEDYIRLLRERMICADLAAAFRRGFETVIAWDALKVFSLKEVLVLLNGILVKPFTLAELEEHVLLDEGYERGSSQIQWLFEVMLEFTDDERIAFVQFVTGSRTLPIGGLGGLRPKIHIARKLDGEEQLPTVSTCQTYLKLPEYRSKEKLKEKLMCAIHEGRDAFDLA
jgi:hypothetical protein